jgi:Do/DeqQ family serine protease
MKPPNALSRRLRRLYLRSPLVWLSATSLLVSLATLCLLWTSGINTPPQQIRDDLRQTPEFQLALRTQMGGSHPDQTMFGKNPSLIADVAEQVAPAVVNLDIEKNASSTGPIVQDTPALPFTPFGEELFRRFFGFDASPENRMKRGLRVPPVAGNGSGVIIDTQGHILTNNHVVSRAEKITVTLNDGRKFAGKVVGRDRFTDLAVVKIEASGLKAAPLGSSQNLRPGEWVLAIGSPLGFDHTVTLGIISAISRRVPDINSNVDFIQTDAAINPGNSGGPLVNLKGEIIGINTAISGSGQNIGFAIPVDVVRQVADALVNKGSITRPYIGMAMGPLNPELAESLGLQKNTEGVVVSQVMANSPSEKAGFRSGDVIQRINGHRVQDPKAVQQLVRENPVGTTLNFQILRDGQLAAVSVKTATLPEEEQANATATPSAPPFGGGGNRNGFPAPPPPQQGGSSLSQPQQPQPSRSPRLLPLQER